MNTELINMIDFLNTLLFSNYELENDEENLIAFNKKDPTIFAYGIFKNYKEERGKTKRVYKLKEPIKVFIIKREEDNTYVYDELENQDYDFNKDFKF